MITTKIKYDDPSVFFSSGKELQAFCDYCEFLNDNPWRTLVTYNEDWTPIKWLKSELVRGSTLDELASKFNEMGSWTMDKDKLYLVKEFNELFK